MSDRIAPDRFIIEKRCLLGQTIKKRLVYISRFLDVHESVFDAARLRALMRMLAGAGSDLFSEIHFNNNYFGFFKFHLQ